MAKIPPTLSWNLLYERPVATKPESKNSEKKEPDTRIVKAVVGENKELNRPQRTLKCWKCGKDGHLRQDCTAPPLVGAVGFVPTNGYPVFVDTMAGVNIIGGGLTRFAERTGRFVAYKPVGSKIVRSPEVSVKGCTEEGSELKLTGALDVTRGSLALVKPDMESIDIVAKTCRINGLSVPMEVTPKGFVFNLIPDMHERKESQGKLQSR